MIIWNKGGIIPYIPKKQKEEVVEKKEGVVEYKSIEDAIENIPDFDNKENVADYTTDIDDESEIDSVDNVENKEEDVSLIAVDLQPQRTNTKYRVFEATDGILLGGIIDLPKQGETINIKDRELYVSSVVKTDEGYTIVSTNNILQIKEYN